MLLSMLYDVGERVFRKLLLYKILPLFGLLSFCACKDTDRLVLHELPIDFKQHIVAHRGVWRTEGSAENSLTAIRLAAKLGVWGAEIDIRETSDGHFILNHDEKMFGLDIADTPLDAFKEFHLSNGEPVPILEDALSVLKEYPHFHLQVEVKAGTAGKISEIIERMGVAEQVVIISFEREICEAFLRSGNLPVLFLCHTKHDFKSSRMKNDGYAGVSMNYPTAMQDGTAMFDCQKQGLMFCVWTPDRMSEIALLLAYGVDLVVTNVAEDLTLDLLRENL